MSFLGYDWLLISWLTIVRSYDLWYFAHDPHYGSWVLRMWRKLRTWLVIWILIGLRYARQLTHRSQLMDFALWHTIMMSLCFRHESHLWLIALVSGGGGRLYKEVRTDMYLASLRNHLGGCLVITFNTSKTSLSFTNVTPISSVKVPKIRSIRLGRIEREANEDL